MGFGLVNSSRFLVVQEATFPQEIAMPPHACSSSRQHTSITKYSVPKEPWHHAYFSFLKSFQNFFESINKILLPPTLYTWSKKTVNSIKRLRSAWRPRVVLRQAAERQLTTENDTGAKTSCHRGADGSGQKRSRDCTTSSCTKSPSKSGAPEEQMPVPSQMYLPVLGLRWKQWTTQLTTSWHRNDKITCLSCRLPGFWLLTPNNAVNAVAVQELGTATAHLLRTPGRRCADLSKSGRRSVRLTSR